MSAPGAAPAHLARDARRIKVAAERVAAALAAGGYRSAFRGQGVEFDEVREYHDGDDVRTIDWNVTSRLGGAASPAYASAAYSKVFREERELAILLLVDRSASMLAGSAEKRDLSVWVAAILALSAQFSDDRIGACLFSDRIESWVAPARGRTRVLRLVNDLLHARPAGRGSDLALALRTVAANLQRRSVCIILSDFKTDGYRHELRAVARAHDVIAVRIAEPLDRALPAASGGGAGRPGDRAPPVRRCRRVPALLGPARAGVADPLPGGRRGGAGDRHGRGCGRVAGPLLRGAAAPPGRAR